MKCVAVGAVDGCVGLEVGGEPGGAIVSGVELPPHPARTKAKRTTTSRRAVLLGPKCHLPCRGGTYRCCCSDGCGPSKPSCWPAARDSLIKTGALRLRQQRLQTLYTTFNLVGVKWYGGHGPVSTMSQPFIWLAAELNRF